MRERNLTPDLCSNVETVPSGPLHTCLDLVNSLLKTNMRFTVLEMLNPPRI